LKGKRNDSNLYQKILDAFKERPMATKELANRLKADARKIYSHCRRLEKLGSLKSDLVLSKRLLYCLDDQEVVTEENYNDCHEQDHELRLFPIKERLWQLTSSTGSSGSPEALN
jgi:type I site-specific restriction-modification system R (restriction) subunit